MVGLQHYPLHVKSRVGTSTKRHESLVKHRICNSSHHASCVKACGTVKCAPKCLKCSERLSGVIWSHPTEHLLYRVPHTCQSVRELNSMAARKHPLIYENMGARLPNKMPTCSTRSKHTGSIQIRTVGIRRHASYPGALNPKPQTVCCQYDLRTLGAH